MAGALQVPLKMTSDMIGARINGRCTTSTAVDDNCHDRCQNYWQLKMTSAMTGANINGRCSTSATEDY